MRLYISGPITAQFDHMPRFEAMMMVLERLGHTSLNPLRIDPWHHDGDCPPGRTNPSALDLKNAPDNAAPALKPGAHRDPCHMRSDIYYMLECDGVVALEGWHASTGARLEVEVAMECGMPVYFPIDDAQSPLGVSLVQLGTYDKLEEQ